MDDGLGRQGQVFAAAVAHDHLAEDWHIHLVGIDGLGAVNPHRMAVLQGADDDRASRVGSQTHAEPSIAPVP